ncbi:MAG TPA: protein-disulfide reductase DsbD domain-containing protein [Fimbriimonas sp.]|nr:protein-disulfide reductase DsbD domain-containing protein [Fimbriimonas sp.]
MMILSLVAAAAFQGSNVPPTVTIAGPKAAVAPNHLVKVTVKLKFADGLHGYQNPPSDQYEQPVTVKLKSGPVKLVSVAYPKGKDMKMAGADKPTKVYSGDVSIPVTLKTSAKSGTVVLSVNYQQCTMAACFPPSAVDAKVDLKVGKKK